MAETATVMVLKVDLQCASCYKKVKKVLCKFPQIRDQVYDEKANTVTITVVCCSPEKIRDKLCCKGAKFIKSIVIKEPPKPKEPEKPKDAAEKPKPVAKPKEPETPKPVPVNTCGPAHGYPQYPTGMCCGPCSEGYGGGPCYQGYGRPVPPPPPCPYGWGYGYEYGYRANKSGCVRGRCFSEENPQGCTIM